MTFVVIPFQYVDIGQNRELPEIIFTGDRVQWAVDVTGFSSNQSYLVEWHFHGPTPVTAYSSSESDGSHLLELSSAQTTALTLGDYQWQAQVTGNDVRQTIATGKISVRQGLFGADPGDVIETRSDAKVALENIDAALAGKASNDVMEYEIRGRSLKRYPIGELMRLRQLFSEQCRREEIAERLSLGKPGAGKVKVTFR